MIITEELAGRALNIVEPTIYKLLEECQPLKIPDHLWIAVKAPGTTTMYFERTIESQQRRLELGENKNFRTIAEKLRRVAEREQQNTSVVAQTAPWRLAEDELAIAGGAYKNEISVGVAGAHNTVNEGIAMLIIDTIITLVFADAEKTREWPKT